MWLFADHVKNRAHKLYLSNASRVLTPNKFYKNKCITTEVLHSCIHACMFIYISEHCGTNKYTRDQSMHMLRCNTSHVLTCMLCWYNVAAYMYNLCRYIVKYAVVTVLVTSIKFAMATVLNKSKGCVLGIIHWIYIEQYVQPSFEVDNIKANTVNTLFTAIRWIQTSAYSYASLNLTEVCICFQTSKLVIQCSQYASEIRRNRLNQGTRNTLNRLWWNSLGRGHDWPKN